MQMAGSEDIYMATSNPGRSMQTEVLGIANARDTWSVQGHALASLEQLAALAVLQQLAALECKVLRQARGEHSWVKRYLAFHACIMRAHGSDREFSRTMQRSATSW